MHIDDTVVHSGTGERFQTIGNQRLSRHFDQRLGQSVGDRAHTGAKPRGKDHGGVDGHQLGSSGL